MRYLLAAPLLMLGTAALAQDEPASDVTAPQVAEFGASRESIESALEPYCESSSFREISPPRIPFAERSQSHIDCFGFEFYGEKRLAEFVFADGELVLIWVLVDAEDKPAILADMRSTYGEDGHSGEGFTAFTDHHTAWRDEPPELLFYGERAAPLMAAYFSAN